MRNLSFSLLTTVILSAPASAQAPTVTAARSSLGPCSYETCALRLDRAIFGGRKIIIGLDAVSSPFGLAGGGLVSAVGQVPGALEEAQSGRRNAIKSAILGLLGSLAIVYSVQGTQGIDPLEWNDAQVFGGLIAGSVGVVAGVVQATYAERHFSRAVWLYNRELTR